METEELILKDGNFVRRETSITETVIGDAAGLLAKYMTKPAFNVGNIGTVLWGGDRRLFAHVLMNGTRALVYTLLPDIRVSLTYLPVMKPEFVDAYNDRDPSLAKDLKSKILGWSYSANPTGTPTEFLERKIPLVIPWEANIRGQLIFSVECTMNPSYMAPLTATGAPVAGSAYLTVLRSKKLYPIRLANHYSNGKICLGNDWDGSRATKTSYVDILQHALNTYINAQNNRDLYEMDMDRLWSLEPEIGMPYWVNQPSSWPKELKPRYPNIMKDLEVSVSSFLGLI